MKPRVIKIQKLSWVGWMIRVDKELWKLAKVKAADLPDFCYHEFYMLGDSPKDCAEEAVSYAKECF